jgi:dCMP deaminase
MKKKFINLYMDWAKRVAECSYAKRLQVGAVIVKDDCVISYGYNGMPSGWDNNCEDTEYTYDERDTVNGDWTYDYNSKRWSKLKTKQEVLHAESNAIAKLAKSNNSGVGSSIFITHSPCIECAKLIYQSGISTVYYDGDYRSDDGIKFLLRSGVEVVRTDKTII